MTQRPATPKVRVAAGVIYRDQKVLITKRVPGVSFGGLWEFPGGKQEPGETLEECLRRELHEELGIQVYDPETFLVVDHHYPGKRVELHFYLCRTLQGHPSPIECSELAWIDPLQLKTFSFPEADRAVIDKIEEFHRTVNAGEGAG